MLQSMESQRTGQDCATELNCSQGDFTKSGPCMDCQSKIKIKAALALLRGLPVPLPPPSWKKLPKTAFVLRRSAINLTLQFLKSNSRLILPIHLCTLFILLFSLILISVKISFCSEKIEDTEREAYRKEATPS